ncbi:hypothetical protein [Thiocapsa rosea]|uniref:hypothetical protein n=1 Tax=Thiocapsa rosea TaxID=69360 RepID=UPI001B86C991|nr:hypothetical protein [Thiocapsa rosea]
MIPRRLATPLKHRLSRFPAVAFLVYSGDERYPKGGGFEAIGLGPLAQELSALGV